LHIFILSRESFPCRDGLPPDFCPLPRLWVFLVFPGAAGLEVNIMASRGVNKVTLLGNIGSDPDVRYLPGGGMVVTIRLATTQIWNDQAGQRQERTDWHRVVFFRNLAEIAADYLKKGSRIFVEGCLRYQQWDKDGERRFTTEIVANDLLLLDRANSSDDDSGQNGKQTGNHAGQNRNSANSANRSRKNRGHSGKSQPADTKHNTDSFADDAFDDDIPF
jgi:single-strand DNA-binding protein